MSRIYLRLPNLHQHFLWNVVERRLTEPTQSINFDYFVHWIVCISFIYRSNAIESIRNNIIHSCLRPNKILTAISNGSSIIQNHAGLPDSFAKVSVDGTGQVYTTEPYKGSLDPKWNTHYDLYLGRGDGITITVFNQKKIHKKQGFLGCVRIVAATIQRLKDTGCMYQLNSSTNCRGENIEFFTFRFLFADQRLDLCKGSADDIEPVRGQIIISLMSRDGSSSSGNPLAIVGPGGDIQGPNDDNEHLTSVNDALPEGWEERKTPNGRVYYVNHVTKSTQWDRPTTAASPGTTNNPLNNQHTILTQQTQQSMPQQNGSVNSHANDEISPAVNNGISAGPSKVSTNGSTVVVSQSNGHTPVELLNLGKENCSPSRTNEQQPNMNWSVRVSSDSTNPLHAPTSETVSTPISPSSSGSHLSPVTPKSLNESLGACSPDELRSPTMPVTNQSPVNAANATQQQIANLVPQINHSLLLESPQRACLNANNTAEQEPTSLSSTSNQRSPSDAQSSSQTTTVASPHSEQPNGNSTPGAITSPASAASHTNQNRDAASNLTPSNCHTRASEPSASPSEHSSPATNALASRTVTDGGVMSCTPRAIDVHSQRTRRSSRNLEDSSRRRSSRTARQSTSNAPAVSLVRSGTAFTRPSMDLPLGYGECLIYYFRFPIPFTTTE